MQAEGALPLEIRVAEPSANLPLIRSGTPFTHLVFVQHGVLSALRADTRSGLNVSAPVSQPDGLTEAESETGVGLVVLAIGTQSDGLPRLVARTSRR